MKLPLNRFANLLLLILGMESLCLLVEESFHLLLPGETRLWLALLCLFLWIASSFRFGILIGMPLSALTLYYLYRNCTLDLTEEFQDLMNHISASYYGHYSASSTGAYESLVSSHMTALLFLLFLLAAFTAIALNAGGFRITLCLLASVPVFAACIAVNGSPSVLSVFGSFSYWLGLLFSGDVFRKEDAAWKGLLPGLIGAVLILSLLLPFFGPDHYEYSERDIDLSRQFDRLGNLLSDFLSDTETGPFSLPVSSPSEPTLQPEETQSPSDEAQETERELSEEVLRGWSTHDGILDLRSPFQPDGLDRTVFRLTANLSGSLYLRGRSFGDYDGSRWLPAAENSHASALSYAAQAVFRSTERSEYSFRLSSGAAYDVLYLPYYSISESSSDVSVPADGLRSYGGSFYMPSADGGYGNLPDSLLAEELQYREFVHTYYTRLPDYTRNALLSFAAENGLSADQSDLIPAVARLVRSIGEYDLQVEPYLEGDYAVHFLTESHRGYCLHFATAATVLYRALGVPARLCEGYLVRAVRDRSVDVTGMDGHAWVEVYVDATGWIPVEVTASQSQEDNSLPSDSPPSPDPSASQTPEPEFGSFPDSSPDGSLNPEEAQEPGSLPEETELPGEASSDGGSEAGSASGGLEQLIYTPDEDQPPAPLPLWLERVLEAVGVLLLLFFLRYGIMRAMLSRRLRTDDLQRRAVYVYRQAGRVLSYGGTMPAPIQLSAEKASFSPHQISPDEMKEAEQALRDLTVSVRKSLSPLRRFFFRFWSANL